MDEFRRSSMSPTISKHLMSTFDQRQGHNNKNRNVILKISGSLQQLEKCETIEVYKIMRENQNNNQFTNNRFGGNGQNRSKLLEIKVSSLDNVIRNMPQTERNQDKVAQGSQNEPLKDIIMRRKDLLTLNKFSSTTPNPTSSGSIPNHYLRAR